MVIEPADLRLLHLVELTGSLAGAADELGVSPAAVTQQIARLETRAGLELVARGPRGARLTPAGATLAPHGARVAEELRRAGDSLDMLRGARAERLRIGAIHGAALHLLPPALTALHHRHPHAEVTVSDLLSVDAVAAVQDDTLDLALMAVWDEEPAVPPGLATHELLVDPMLVALPADHPVVRARPRGRSVSLGRLAEESWVVIQSGMAAREQLDRAAGAAGFTPRVRFATGSYDVAQALVGTGYGVAVVSRLARTDHPGTVVRALRPRLTRRIVAVTAADLTLVPLVRTTLGLLADVADELARTWREEDA